MEATGNRPEVEIESQWFGARRNSQRVDPLKRPRSQSASGPPPKGGPESFMLHMADGSFDLAPGRPDSSHEVFQAPVVAR